MVVLIPSGPHPDSRASLLPWLDDPEQPALINPDGISLSHAELRTAVRRMVDLLPPEAEGRRLVHHTPTADTTSVVAYLATLEAGHVALVTSDDPRTERIIDHYPPDVVATGDPDRPFHIHSDRPNHLLHPDLALLLSTSGSTGSPKLVRLSHNNVGHNARAIAAALRLSAEDRSITTLPMHYCFGLSVLHSHLVVGGSLVLHPGSVLDESLWQSVTDHRVTNLAVVPHTLELAESIGALDRAYPALRLIAQAGGRMSPERVSRTARIGATRGWGLAVMYGQTEATARICVLDPPLTADHPDAVGRPVRDTTVALDTSVPEADTGAGEVVVRGPGVMMGYAEHPDDLAVGNLLSELRTGDLGRVDERGILRIVGRRSGFVKIMGLRVDLGTVEQALEHQGLTCCVIGDDHGLIVVTEPEDHRPTERTHELARTVAAASSGLGPASVTVVVASLVRRENGKIDRAGCARLAHSCTPEPAGSTGVVAVLTDVLGVEAIDPQRSFVELGGDSLSHVQASTRLTAVLGTLPSGWHHRPVIDLLARSTPKDTPSSGSRFWRRWPTVETSIVLRAIAVIIICGTHTELFRFLGGAHTLLVVAGFNAARFGLALPTRSSRWRATARTVVGVAVPTAAVALLGMWTTDRYHWANVFLLNWLVGDTHGYHNEFWFVDALVACWLVLALALSVPIMGRWWRRDPWRTAIIMTAVALIPRFVILANVDGLVRGIMPTTLWLFTVGAAAAYASTTRRRLITVAAAILGGATFFPDDLPRTLTLLIGIAVLVLIPQFRLPSWSVPVLSVLAAASLHIYLIQFQVIPWAGHELAATVASLVAGCLLWRVSDGPVRRLQSLIALDRPDRPDRR